MNSFFIRNPSNKTVKSSGKRKGGKIKVHYPKKAKKEEHKITTKIEDDEEIPSDDEEIEKLNDKGRESSDEDSQLTAEEKKLKLAKEYLEQIAKEEKEKLDGEDVPNDVILDRVKVDALSQAGKLRTKVRDKININIVNKDIRVLRCKEHKLSVTCVVLSSDCKFIFSGSKDGSIVKWGIDGKKICVLPPKYKCKTNENLHSSTILSLAVSFDNKYLASSDNESKLIQIWNPNNLDHMFTFTGHRAPVTGLSFCKKSENLYSCSRDKTLKVWNMSSRSYIETLFGHHDCLTSVDVLCNGRVVTSGGTDNTCRVWKINEETHLVYNGNSRSIDGVKRLDDNHFVSCDDNGSISLWGTLKKKPLTSVKNAHTVNPKTLEAFWIASVACISNSEVFASGSNDGFIRLWACSDNYRSVNELSKIPLNGFINSMVFSPDYKFLIVAVGQEHRLGRWDRIKEAKNSVVIIDLKQQTNEQDNGTDTDDS